MNYTLESWIRDILTDDLVVDPNNIDREMDDNYWSFSFPEDDDVSPEAVVDFFEVMLERRLEQVRGKMTYYVWYDEMAHHLCLCFASVTKETLPFGCSIIHAESLRDIVMLYFSSKNGGFIPYDEFRKISIDEALSEDKNETNYKLNVWCKELSGRLDS